MTAQAKGDVQESEAQIKDLENMIKDLETERSQVEAKASERWSQVANDVTEMTIAPLRKDVMLDVFGVAWMPFHLVKAGTEVFELPAYVQAG